MEIIIASTIGVLALLIGFTAGFFIKKQEIKRLSDEKNEITRKNEELNAEIIKLSNENSSDKTKLEMITELQKLVKEDFTAIANKVIKEEQSDLREQNREALEEKLKPLKENFKEFKEKVEEFNKQGATNTEAIKTQIETLLQENKTIKNTAEELSNAIKANSQARGEFGEMILENLLKQSGLINKNEDEEKGNYITQHTYKDLSDINGRPRPDAVVFFPDNKNIIIDAKCPLNNFVEYINSEEEPEKERQLRLFFNAVSEMIDNLGGKYNHLEGLNTPDFKLMFIPLESCASYIYTNQNLTEKAAKANIILVCPSTLLATLKIINRTWTQKNQAENLDRILKSAASTYDKLDTFIKKAEEIQKSMENVQKAFEGLMTTSLGRGGLVKQIAGLGDILGKKHTERINQYLTEETETAVE